MSHKVAFYVTIETLYFLENLISNYSKKIIQEYPTGLTEFRLVLGSKSSSSLRLLS